MTDLTHSVAVVAFDGISPFHLAVPCTVLGEDRTADGIPRYDVRVCAAGPRTARTSAGFTITATHGLAGIHGAGTVIVPSWRSPAEAPPGDLLQAVRDAHADGARVVALCLGAFVVAASGLLDGRTATTHWRYADELTRRYPAVDVDPNRLWIDHGDVITSAGTAASIDCCLHLVRSDHGADIANRLARRLVVPAHRSGDQAQYIERPLPVEDSSDAIEQLLVWMRAHLDRPISTDAMAARANLSRRHLTRRFRSATGTSPLHWLLTQRLYAAQALLETTTLPVEQIAERTGLGSPASLRLHFRRAFGTSPQAYRQAFASEPSEPSVATA